MTISASEVKMRGVGIFDYMFEKFNEVVINVRGKDKYCVIPFEEYEEYRAYKLEMTHKEIMKDIENAKFHTDTKKHFTSIEEALQNE